MKTNSNIFHSLTRLWYSKILDKSLVVTNIFICSSNGMLIKRIYAVMLELSVAVFTAINSNPDINVMIEFFVLDAT